jgi:hypothetical protein
MAIKFKVGDAVRQVMPAPLQGVVVEATIIGSEVHYKVEDAGGYARFFAEDQIEAAPAAAPAPAPADE